MKPAEPRKPITRTVQEVCIDLPGETVQCWRSSDKVRVVLRKHRDVFFDVCLQDGASYVVESNSEFYSPLHRKLLRRIEFLDGDRFHIWVGRNFKGSLVLKSNDRVLGSFEVNKLDQSVYDAAPKTKPEPLMIVMGKRMTPGVFSCTHEDPFGVRGTQSLFKPELDSKLSMLNDFGIGFRYSYSDEVPRIEEYVAIVEAQAKEIQPQVVQQLDRGGHVTGNIDQIFVAPKSGEPLSPLYRAMGYAGSVISGNEMLASNWFKETSGYLQENFRALNKVGMTVRIERKAKGKYRVAFKGRPVTTMLGQALGMIRNAKASHQTMSLGSGGSAFLDGGYGKTGKAGYGGARRILLTSGDNFKAGMKVQVIGTIIDIMVDANTVFGERGSEDWSEFLGRAGVTLVKAGATAALGSLIAAGVTAGAVAVGAPVVIIIAVVIAGYVLAASLIDMVDDQFAVKERVADMAR